MSPGEAAYNAFSACFGPTRFNAGTGKQDEPGPWTKLPATVRDAWNQAAAAARAVKPSIS